MNAVNSVGSYIIEHPEVKQLGDTVLSSLQGGKGLLIVGDVGEAQVGGVNGVSLFHALTIGHCGGSVWLMSPL